MLGRVGDGNDSNRERSQCVLFQTLLLTQYQQGAYLLGLWGPSGPKVRRAPFWVDTQQSTELYAALCVHSIRCINIGENIYSWFSTTWAHWPRFAVAELPRALRRNTRYYNLLPIDCASLESLWDFFSESAINPADPISKYSNSSPRQAIVEAHTRMRLYDSLGPHIY